LAKRLAGLGMGSSPFIAFDFLLISVSPWLTDFDSLKCSPWLS